MNLRSRCRCFATITKAIFAPRAGDDFRAVTADAIQLATSGRPGPVCVEVPTDLLAGEVTIQTPAAADNGSETPIPLTQQTLTKPIAILRRAKQPVIMAGTDAVRSNLSADLTALAEALMCPSPDQYARQRGDC